MQFPRIDIEIICIPTFVRLNCRFPLYQVIIAFGLEPVLSQITSYLRSATNVVGGFIISTVRGFTEKEKFFIIFRNILRNPRPNSKPYIISKTHLKRLQI